MCRCPETLDEDSARIISAALTFDPITSRPRGRDDITRAMCSRLIMSNTGGDEWAPGFTLVWHYWFVLKITDLHRHWRDHRKSTNHCGRHGKFRHHERLRSHQLNQHMCFSSYQTIGSREVVGWAAFRPPAGDNSAAMITAVHFASFLRLFLCVCVRVPVGVVTFPPSHLLMIAGWLSTPASNHSSVSWRLPWFSSRSVTVVVLAKHWFKSV